MIELVLYLVGFGAILLGVITDMQTREVPDWVNYGLVFGALGIRLIGSLVFSDWSLFIEGFFGFLAFFLFALIMYYGHQWGGGDAKMLMGIGAVIGLPVTWPLGELLHVWFQELPLLALFLLHVIWVGGLYGLGWCIYLIIKHRKKLAKELSLLAKKRMIRRSFSIAVVSLLLLVTLSFVFFEGLMQSLFLIFVGGLFIMYLLLVGLHSLEKACMYKQVPVSQLTLGDWVAKPVIIDKREICGPKGLGITEKQLLQLQKLSQKKKVTKVWIKEGIPFTPTFAIAFLFTILLEHQVLTWIF